MSNFIIHDGELYHHGVKGMKWGVRKKKSSISEMNIRNKRSQKADKVKTSEKNKKHKNLAKKGGIIVGSLLAGGAAALGTHTFISNTDLVSVRGLDYVGTTAAGIAVASFYSRTLSDLILGDK